MPGRLQFPKRLHAAPALRLTSCVMKAELLAYPCSQFVSVTDFVAFKQPADIFYLRGLRQGPFDLVLCIHAARVHGTKYIAQHLFEGKEQC